MDESESSEKPDEMGRRDFLKVAGVTLGGAAIPNRLVEKRVQKEKEKERIKIETKNATYYPFYERHDIGISTEEIDSLNKIDLHYREGPLPSHLAMSLNVRDIFQKRVQMAGDKDTTIRFFEDEKLNLFSEKDTFVSMETGVVPGTLSTRKMSELAQAVPGTGLLLATALESIQKAKDDEPLNLLEVARKTGMLTAGFWATSKPITMGLLGLSENYYPDPQDKESLKRIIRRIHGLQSHAHPEDQLVFFRNVIMARQLTLLGQKLPEIKQVEGKPSVSFQVGGAHSGIEDLIRLENLGDGFSIAILELYPDDFIEEVLNMNARPEDKIEKKIEIFSSVIAFPVKENLEDGQNLKHVLVDGKLRDYLKERLLKESNSP